MINLYKKSSIFIFALISACDGGGGGGNGTRSGDTQSASGCSTPSDIIDGPKTAIDLSGNVAAIWQGGPGDRGIIARNYNVISHTWSDEINLPLAANADNAEKFPRVIMDAKGNATAAWVDNDATANTVNSINSIWANRYDATTQQWGMTLALDPEGSDKQQGPSLGTDAAGHVLAVWSGTQPTLAKSMGNIYSRYDIQSKLWSTAAAIPSNAGLGMPGNDPTSLYVTSNGQAVLVWFSIVRFTATPGVFEFDIWVNFYDPTDPSNPNPWGPAEKIGIAYSRDQSSAETSVSIAMNDTRHTVVSWRHNINNIWRITSNYYDPVRASWSGTSILDAGTISAATPRSVIDSNGYATLTWADDYNGASTGLTADRQVWSRRFTPGTELTTGAWNILAPITTSASYNILNHQLLMRANNNIVALWNQKTSLASPYSVFENNFDVATQSWGSSEASPIIDSNYINIRLLANGKYATVTYMNDPNSSRFNQYKIFCAKQY